MQLLIIGDTHFKKISNNIESRYRTRVLEFIKGVIEKHNIKHALQLGDFFDDRRKIDVEAFQNTLSDYKKTFGGLDKFYALLGNHDTYYKSTNEVYSTSLTASILDNFEVVDKIRELDFGYVCPWVNDSNLFQFEEMMTDIKDKNVFGHFEINGFAKVKGFQETNGISLKSLRQAKNVISGHFHLTQDNGNISYVGSLFQNDFNDVNDIKRVFIFDTETDEYQEIRIPITLFERVSISEESQMINELINSFTDKIVQVIFNIEKSVKREKFIQKLIDTDVISDIKIIDNSALLDEKVELNNTNEDIIEIFSDYIQTSEVIDDERKEHLKEMFVETYENIKEG